MQAPLGGVRLPHIQPNTHQLEGSLFLRDMVSGNHLKFYRPQDPEQVAKLIYGMEDWLRGNLHPSDELEGLKVAESAQIDEATLGLRRLIHDGDGEYAIFRSQCQTITPNNLCPAFYMALRIENEHGSAVETAESAIEVIPMTLGTGDEDGPAVETIPMKCGQLIFIESPVLLGPNITFLVVKVSLLLVERADHFAGQQMVLNWYRKAIKSRGETHHCPECGKGWNSWYRLSEHFHDTHPDYCFYKQGPWGTFEAAFLRFLNNENFDEYIPRNGDCFKAEWIEKALLISQEKLSNSSKAQSQNPRARNMNDYTVTTRVSRTASPIRFTQEDT